MGVAIWYYVGLKKNQTVPLSLSSIEKLFGVQRDSLRRGLLALEKDGLVSVERKAGCSPRVTLIDVG